MSVTTALLLFLPPFVATELIAALPGSKSARETLEQGLGIPDGTSSFGP
jgi:hypothetical protein